MSGKDKTIEYRRAFARISNGQIWIDAGKWKPLRDLLDQSKGKMDTLVIESPEVLGDTYREFVVNLAMIADAGLKVMIKPGSKKVLELRPLGENSSIEVLLAEDADVPQKRGGGILRIGRSPSVVLVSYAPDEIYAQAELLVMLEKEVYKPSSEGREIEGRYETGPGTVDEFFQEWIEKPEDLKLLEKMRLEILEKGWSSFVYGSQMPAPKQDFSRSTLNHRIISKDANLDREDPLLKTVIEDMKKSIPKEGTFTCTGCMESRDMSLFDSVGLLGVDGIDRPNGKLKSLPYPICKKCASLSRERLFAEVMEHIHAYGSTMKREWETKDSERKDIGEALKNLDSLLGNDNLPLIVGDLAHPEQMEVPALADATSKVKDLIEHISKVGNFICVCCLKKKTEKHLETVGSHVPKATNGEKEKPKSLVYPVCDKCSKLATGDMAKRAEENWTQWKAI